MTGIFFFFLKLQEFDSIRLVVNKKTKKKYPCLCDIAPSPGILDLGILYLL